METKTIRFEKDIRYLDEQIDAIAVFLSPIPGLFVYDYEETNWLCLKSFTVQINIIEDEQPVTKGTCPHPEWSTDGGGDYCKKCGYRL